MSDATPSPEEVRALLRECVTVVRPGEVLVIRVPHDTPWEESRSYQRVLDAAREEWGISAVVVTADELGVIPAAGDEAFDKRVMAAINRLDVWAEMRGGAGVRVHAEPGCPWVGGEAVMPAPAFIAKGADDRPAHGDGTVCVTRYGPCGCADDPADA